MKKSIWQELVQLFQGERELSGLSNAAIRVACALNALRFREKQRELATLRVFQDYCASSENPDALFHLSHRYYLSTRMSYRDRIDSALTHYGFETEHYDDCYRTIVYRGTGLPLWSHFADGVNYSIRLRRPTTPDHEGGTSVLLLAEDVCLSEMSYAWVDGRVLGGTQGIIPFITRNQSTRHDDEALRRFRQAFPHNSPSYCCLAAMHGVARAQQRSVIAGIRHDCQIAFDQQHAGGFINSYSKFWQSFGGVELDEHAYVMPVPLAVPPLSSVKSNHRRRAAERRRIWDSIEQSARGATSRHRKTVALDPSLITRNAGEVLTMLASHVPTMLWMSMVF